MGSARECVAAAVVMVLVCCVPAAGNDWLASTPETPMDDPALLAASAGIGAGSYAVCDFVRDQTVFETYRGSLRGARGTLWAGAGNSVDRASLLIALLRIRGYGARYVHGQLSEADAGELLASMFDEEQAAQAIGYVPPGVEMADPLTDPELVAEARDHWWVELENGTQWDPCFPDGQPRATPVETQFEIPPSARQMVTLRLVAEFQGALMSLLREEIPFDRAFPAAELHGRPPVLGFDVAVDQSPTMISALGIKKYNYVPYLVLDDGDEDPANNLRISGHPFTEMYGFLNLVNTTLTGLRLEVQTTGPGAVVRTHSRDLVDRIGFGARHGLGEPSSITAEDPALDELRTMAIHVVCGPIDGSVLETRKTMRLELAAEAELLRAAMSDINATPPEDWTEDDLAVLRDGTRLACRGLRLDTRILGEKHLLASFPRTRDLADVFLVRAYTDHPLVILCDAAPDKEAEAFGFSLDLRHNSLRAVPYPGQSAEAPALFVLRRGYVENLVERSVMEQVRCFLGRRGRSEVLSTIAVFEAAADQGIPIVLLSGPGDVARVDSMDLSADARARIRLALAAGDSVNVPEHMVEIDHRAEIGWYRIDAETGESIGVMESGCHQAIAEYGLEIYLTAITAEAALISMHRWYLYTFLPWLEATQAYIDREVETYRRGEDYNEVGDYRQASIDAQTMTSMVERQGYSIDGWDQWNIEEPLQELPSQVVGFYERDEVDHVIFDEYGDPVLFGQEEGERDWRVSMKEKYERIDRLIEKLRGEASPFADTVPEAQDLMAELDDLEQMLHESWDDAMPVAYPSDYLQLNEQMNMVFGLVSVEVKFYELEIWSHNVDEAMERPAIHPLNYLPTAGRPSHSVIEYRGTDLEVVSYFAYPEIAGDIQAEDAVGVRVEVVQDPIFAVKTGIGQAPTAFRVRVGNTGAANDRFLVQGVPPAGWNLLVGREVNEIPAGAVGRGSIFLQPRETTALPAVGTPLDFTVTATSESNPAVAVSRDVQFEMPPVAAVSVSATPASVSVVPGGTVELRLAARNTGNVSQRMVMKTTVPTGLTAGSLPVPEDVAPGDVLEHMWVVTADALPLGTELVIGIEFELGATGAGRRVLEIPVRISPPGVVPAEEGATSADALGRRDLADALRTIGADAVALYSDPSATPVRARLAATVAALRGFLGDPLLAGYGALLETAGAAVGAATPGETEAALNDLGTALAALAERLTELAAHDCEVGLEPNVAIARPQTPTGFGVRLRNHGSEETTYDLSLDGVPPGVTASVTPTWVTLPGGFAIAPYETGADLLEMTVMAEMTQPAGRLEAFEFRLVATPREAPDLARAAVGAFTLRKERIGVQSVATDPAFGDPGTDVGVTARLLSVVNEDRPVMVRYRVIDRHDVERFVSSPVEAGLTVLASLETVDLGAFDTTGFPGGNYQVEVDLAEIDGTPVPGAAGAGDFLCGLPLSVSWGIAPADLPPGDGEAAVTLRIESLIDYATERVALVGVRDTEGTGRRIALNDRYAYVGGSENVTTVHVDDPTDPVIVDTFSSGGETCLPAMHGDRLLVMHGLDLEVYAVTDPAAPALVTAEPSGVTGTSGAGFLVTGDVGLMNTILYGWQGSSIIFTRGDTIVFDVSDPDHPECMGLLYDYPHSRWPQWPGSEYYIGQRADGTGGYAYLCSRSAKAAEAGVGRLRIIDVSDPATVHETAHYDVPGTAALHAIAIADDRALVLGSTGTFAMINGSPKPTGDVTLHLLDLGNPVSPVVLGSTQLAAIENEMHRARMAAGPDGRYVIEGYTESGVARLAIVDTSDPGAIDVETFDSTDLVQDALFAGNVLYTAGADGLAIRDLSAMAGIPLDVSLLASNDADAAPAPGTIAPPPDGTVPGADADSLEWSWLLTEASPSAQAGWAAALPSLSPGEPRVPSPGGAVEFTVRGTRATIQLPPLVVTGAQILGLTPDRRTIRPGEAAEFTVRLTNPTAAASDFDLDVRALPGGWASVASPVTVPGGASVDVPLAVESDRRDGPGEYPFRVVATMDPAGADPAVSEAPGTVELTGDAVAAAPVRAVIVALAPARATGGQGTPAEFTVRVTNAGNANDRFALSADLPPGMSVRWGRPSLDVPPGADASRETLLWVTPDPGTPVGEVPFTVTATSATDPLVVSESAGAVDVVDAGVGLEFVPPALPHGATTVLRVTNRGSVPATFDLALYGPAAPACAMATETLALDPGAVEDVAIDVAAIDYLAPGETDLTARAVAREVDGVAATATAAITVPATRGIELAMSPVARAVDRLGRAAFALQVRNAGNLEERLTARITGSSGPVTAELAGLDGQPMQRIDAFRVSPMSPATVELALDLKAAGEGTATVAVQSTDQAGIAGDAEAILGAVRLAIRRTTQGAEVLFTPVTAHDHVIERADHLPGDPTWIAMPGGPHNAGSLVDPADVGKRFYDAALVPSGAGNGPGPVVHALNRVGRVRVTILAGGTGTVSSPMTPPAVAAGLVQSTGASYVSAANGATWPDNAFGKGDESYQTHYLEIVNGDHEGRYWAITANTGSLFLLETDATELSTLGLEGAGFVIRPFVTVSELFGDVNGASLLSGGDNPADASNVLAWDGAGFETIYFSTFAGEDEWRAVGRGPANEWPVYPDEGLLVVNRGDDPVTIESVGEVAETAKGSRAYGGLTLLANPFPADVAVGDAKLMTSEGGPCAGAPSPAQADQVLLWDGEGYELIYFSTFFGENRWRSAGGGDAADRLLEAGRAFFLNRQAVEPMHWRRGLPYTR